MAGEEPVESRRENHFSWPDPDPWKTESKQKQIERSNTPYNGIGCLWYLCVYSLKIFLKLLDIILLEKLKGFTEEDSYSLIKYSHKE